MKNATYWPEFATPTFGAQKSPASMRIPGYMRYAAVANPSSAPPRRTSNIYRGVPAAQVQAACGIPGDGGNKLAPCSDGPLTGKPLTEPSKICDGNVDGDPTASAQRSRPAGASKIARRDRQSLSHAWRRMGDLVHVAHEGAIPAGVGESKANAGESRLTGRAGTPLDAQRMGAFGGGLPVRSPVSHSRPTPSAPARSGSSCVGGGAA